jgi:hypothetical protein
LNKKVRIERKKNTKRRRKSSWLPLLIPWVLSTVKGGKDKQQRRDVDLYGPWNPQPPSKEERRMASR